MLSSLALFSGMSGYLWLCVGHCNWIFFFFRKNFKFRMKLFCCCCCFFFPKKDLHLAVVLPFWDCFKQKFKAWGSLEYPSSVGEAGLPLVHPYPKGGALWNPSFFPQGSPTWLPTLCRLWTLISIPFMLWDHQKINSKFPRSANALRTKADSMLSNFSGFLFSLQFWPNNSW